MIKQVHIHPDNLVLIREDDEIVYQDTVSNFESDYGASLDSMDSWNERLYIQGVFDRFCNGFTQQTTLSSWTQGDDILDNVADIVAAKVTREGG